MNAHFKGIYYRTFGNSDHPAVLFLHGFMGSSQDWNEIIAKISGSYFCIALDLPGHGKSNNLNELKNIWTFDDLSVLICNLIVYLSIKNTSLVGYSMGGRIAQYFILKYPDLVNKLILESASPGIRDEKEKAVRFQKDMDTEKRLREGSFKEFLNSWYDQPFFKLAQGHPKYNEMINRRLKNDPRILAKALIAYSAGKQPYLAEKLSHVKIPVQLICGAKDQKYLDIMKELKEKNPVFRFTVLKNCGHNCHFDDSDQFAEHLVEFLSL